MRLQSTRCWVRSTVRVGSIWRPPKWRATSTTLSAVAGNGGPASSAPETAKPPACAASITPPPGSVTRLLSDVADGDRDSVGSCHRSLLATIDESWGTEHVTRSPCATFGAKWRRRSGRAGEPTRSVAVVALEDDRAVMAAEADVVAHRVADLHRPRGAVDDVQVDLGVLVAVVERGRRGLVVDAQHGEHALDRAGGTHQVAGHRLRRANRHGR